MILWNYEREQKIGEYLEGNKIKCSYINSSINVLNARHCQTHSLVCLYKHMSLCDIPFLIHRDSYEVGPTFAAITASCLLGWIFTTFRSVFKEIFDYLR